MRMFPRWPPHGLRRRQLLKRRVYWLRAGQVPKAPVDLDRAASATFDRFNAFRAQLTDRVLPVELFVVLHRNRRNQISLWYPPSKIRAPMLIGYVAGEGAAVYHRALDRLAPDQVAMAGVTALPDSSGGYAAVVDGLPQGWSEPPHWSER